MDIEEAPGLGGMQTWRLIGEDARVELIPERGALVTRFHAGGRERLYLDEATVVDRSKNVRGGIPVLFPIAGKAPEGSAMKQHGFARNRAWTVASAHADDATARLELSLFSDADTRALFPHDFEARFTVSLYGQRLLLELAVENTGRAPMPLQLGYHPYFAVEDKRRARVETNATRAFDNRTGVTGPVPPLDFTADELDVHLLDHSLGGTSLGPVRLSWSDAFNTLVLWTLRDKPFICVEPWTARGEALQAGETRRAAFEISVY